MAEIGWISLHRKLQEHWIWKERRVFSKAEAWIDILWEVNHAKNEFIIGMRKLVCERGESLNSLGTWAKRWNWSTSRVKRFLELLESEGMISLKNETQTTRLKVIKYNTYQEQRNANDFQSKRDRNANDFQSVTNNNDNNVNNDNNTKGVGETPDYFMMIFHQNLPPRKEFVDAWTMWIDYCRASDIKINRYSASEQLRFLKMELLEKRDIVQIIKDSITNNYKGLKYGKQNSGNNGRGSGNKGNGASVEELAEIIERHAARTKAEQPA